VSADLGVPWLGRMFEYSRELRAGRAGRPSAEARIDRAVLDTLGVHREPAFPRLVQAGSLEEFTDWVVACNGGAIADWRLARARELSGASGRDPEVERRLAAVDAMEPVLSDDDLAHWDEHGYVVLREAIPRELCERIERAVREQVAARPLPGIMVPLYDLPAQREARELPRIHKAFAQLWGSADLVMTADRAGFNPPEEDGRPFPGPHLHWDVESFEPPLPFGTQGIAYLTDTAADQGAFRCVPGFHRRIEAWLAELPAGADPQQQDLEALGAEPIAARAGDLIIWHAALPHGASPNRASKPRFVQYMKMYAPPPLPAAAPAAA
jgi:hypothetical protein